MKRVFIVLAVLAIVLSSMAVGLKLSPFLARELGFSAFNQATAEREEVPGRIVEIIGAAKQSVVLATETFDSKIVLDALVAAGQRKVSVVVVLSGPANRSQSAGLSWLSKMRIPVRTTQNEFKGLILICDKRYAGICASPIVSAQAFAAAQASLFIFDHKLTAQNFYERIGGWKFN